MRRFIFGLIGLTAILSLGACGGGGGFTGSVGGTIFGTKQLGVTGVETSGYSVATDASGNVFIAGRTQGALDGSTFVGMRDAFFTEYTGAGSKVITRLLGAAGTSVDTSGFGVATDGNGNVFITGYTGGDLDGNTLTGSVDSFLTEYDSAGNKIYTKQLGASGSATYGKAVATDSSGNVYFTGYTTGGIDGHSQTGAEDFILIKYDSAGNKLYSKQMGASGKATNGLAVATDGNGNVYVGGITTGGIDGHSLTGTDDFFLIKYDSSGNKLYSKQMGVAGADTELSAIAVDGNGNVYVVGYTNGNFDGNTLTGIYDLIVTKFDSSGNKLYTKQLGVAGAETYGLSAATDVSGNIFATGYTTGGLDGNSVTGTRDMFLTEYDSTGNKVYTKQDGVAGNWTIGSGVATDASGNVYVGGTTYGDLDGNTLTGSSDFFLMKYDGAGQKL